MKFKSAKISSKDRLYNIDIPIVGLTGGIATGKSTCSKILQEKGAPVICADTLVKNIYKEEKTIEFIQKEAPDTVKDHQVNFKLLREKFFNNDDLKIKTENFIYSKLQSEF